MNERTVAKTRFFDAPRERVFEAWTRAEHPEDGGKTKLVLNTTARGSSDMAAKFLAGMEEGWAQTIDRLGTHLRR